MVDIILWPVVCGMIYIVYHGFSVLKIALLCESYRNTNWARWEENKFRHIIDPFFYGYPGFLMRKKVKYRIIIDRKNSQILFLCKPTKFQLFYEIFDTWKGIDIVKMSDDEVIMSYKSGIIKVYKRLSEHQEEYRRKSGKKNVTRFVEDIRKAESL